jgi:hypothetical protein
MKDKKFKNAEEIVFEIRRLYNIEVEPTESKIRKKGGLRYITLKGGIQKFNEQLVAKMEKVYFCKRFERAGNISFITLKEEY